MIALPLHFLLVFLARHWLSGFINAGLTLVLGLALLRVGRRFFSAPRLLKLRAWLLAAACFKGAFFLLKGDSRHARVSPHLVWGIQLPDPIEMLYLTRQSQESLWHPAGVTDWLSDFLLAFALLALTRRVLEMRRATRSLIVLDQLIDTVPPPRVTLFLKRAAQAIGLPQKQALPTILLAEVSYPTPVLLGLRRTRLILAPSLLAAFSDDELEMALRHELAHLLRHDQWSRWILTLVKDVGWLNPLIQPLSQHLEQVEEILCDQIAVQSPQEAYVLASAITKATSLAMVQQKGGGLTKTVRLPVGIARALQGQTSQLFYNYTSTQERLEALLALSKQLVQQKSDTERKSGTASHAASQRTKPLHRRFCLPQMIERSMFWLFFLVVLYLKYYITPDIN